MKYVAILVVCAGALLGCGQKSLIERASGSWVLQWTEKQKKDFEELKKQGKKVPSGSLHLDPDGHFEIALMSEKGVFAEGMAKVDGDKIIFAPDRINGNDRLSAAQKVPQVYFLSADDSKLMGEDKNSWIRRGKDEPMPEPAPTKPEEIKPHVNPDPTKTPSTGKTPK